MSYRLSSSWKAITGIALQAIIIVLLLISIKCYDIINWISTYQIKLLNIIIIICLTDRLSSVHVAAQKQFLIQASKRQVFDWEQFKFKMQFQQGALHQSETCEVK